MRKCKCAWLYLDSKIHHSQFRSTYVYLSHANVVRIQTFIPSRFTERRNAKKNKKRRKKGGKKEVNQAKLEFSCICYGTTFGSVGWFIVFIILFVSHSFNVLISISYPDSTLLRNFIWILRRFRNSSNFFSSLSLSLSIFSATTH